MRFDKLNVLIDKTNSKIFRNAFFIFVLASFIVTPILTYLLYSNDQKLYKPLIENSTDYISFTNEIVSQTIANITEDTDFLSQQASLTRYIEARDENALHQFEKDILTFSKCTKKYDQIRYIDNSGKEVVRVNFKAGSPYLVEKEKLQDKKSRYYFMKTMQLAKGDFFISELDLNIENKLIELPFKPTIRVSIPIFNSKNEKMGIVIINYLAQDLFNKMKKMSPLSQGRLMMVNSNGYWLLSDEEGDMWGFMLNERNSRKFQNDFPREWEEMSTTKSGTYIGENGLFSFRNIYVMKNGQISTSSSTDNIFSTSVNWKLIFLIPQDILKSYKYERILKLLLTVNLIIIIGSIPSWYLTKTYIRIKLNKEILDISSKYDYLTKLPNSITFQEKLTSILKFSMKFHKSFGLIIFDLEHFKTINEKFGRQAGDNLLTSISNQISEKLDDKGILSRIGGDKFAVIIKDLQSTQEAEQIASGIIHIIDNTNAVFGRESRTAVNIGISIFPNDGYESIDIIQKAELALLNSISKGSNTYSFFTLKDI